MLKKTFAYLYPFLIAIYPVLALKNFNSTYVDLASILRSLVIVLLITALVWLITFGIFRKRDLSGVITSLVMIIILAYGHVYIQIENGLGHPLRHTVLAGLFAIGLALSCWLLLKRPTAVSGTSQFLANTAVILVVMSLGQSAVNEVNRIRAANVLSKPDQVQTQNEASASLPDIYLIVLDGHGRSDVLQSEFGFDNSQFINRLTDMGFYVAQCSQSNYASTNYSLTSMFQMDYIQLVNGRDKLPDLKNTPFLETLRAAGYSVVTFENYASGHFDLGEDLRLSRHQFALGQIDLSGGLNEFEKIMLNTSITRLFLDTEIIPGFNENKLVQLEYYEHYLQTKYILKKLPEIPKLKSPKFVFVHILVPHIPHVFTPDGNFRYPDDPTKNGYRDNAMFIDDQILPVLHEVIAQSEKPPVIILMGDHGPPANLVSPELRMHNLDAYLVNADAKSKLYASITPVNSFRIILDEYLGSDYPLLNDVSYYAYQLRQLKQSPTIIENTCK
ncbi:MAG: sulfatase-like hydrolase/transferase [Chloroflexota bacterium]